MIKSALRSIKDDFSRSLFYWLTFVLTSMFMFLFFHLSLSDFVGVTFINSTNNMETFITVLVIVICMVVIYFANDFYVKKKSKELAVRLVCGATYMQIASYLLIQTMLLFVLAIPFGILLAVLSFPIINQGLHIFTEMTYTLNIQGGAIISTIIILVVEI
ncbi:MAG: FtsX-like permease family protein, partial [Faecalibacillus sp.]